MTLSNRARPHRALGRRIRILVDLLQLLSDSNLAD